MRYGVPHISLLCLAQSAICALALSQMIFPVRAQSVSVRSPHKPRHQHPVKSDHQTKAKAKARVSSTGETTVKKADPVADQTLTESPTTSPEPKPSQLTGATPFKGDLRELPQTKPVKQERPKRPEPPLRPVVKDHPDPRSD